MAIAHSGRFPRVDFNAFHEAELPTLLAAGRGRTATATGAPLDPLAFRVGGNTYTYAWTSGGIEISAGDSGARTIVGLGAASFANLVNEIQTAPGLLYANEIAVERGSYEHMDAWEPALRAVWNGRPVYDPSAPLLDGQGRNLDLARSFDSGASDEEMQRFLQTAGFLHMRRVFSRSEIDDLREGISCLVAASTPGDHRSWWATNRRGERVCCRLLYLAQRDPRFRTLDDDPRLRRIAHLSGEPLVTLCDRMDGHSAVIKNGDIVEGLSDLPWHTDCGLGGHPIICPSINIGVQLDAATTDTGRLGFVPGSHRATAPRVVSPATPVVHVDTEPGDLTAHFGHAMHVAPAPSGSGRLRVAIYSTWYRPSLAEHIGPGEAYNDALFRSDGSVPSTRELV